MQYSTLTILLVDENPGGVQTLQQMLSPVPDMHFKLAHVQELKKGLKWLSKAPIDVVLLDLPAGDDRKLQDIRQIHAMAPEVPVVVLAAFVAFDADMRILQSGAQDIIVKAEMTAPTLIRSIRHALARMAFARSASTPTDTKPTTTPIQSPAVPPAPADSATTTEATLPGEMPGVDSPSTVVNEEASSVIVQEKQEGGASPQTPA